MLLTDLAGNIMPSGVTEKIIGGNFDSLNGIPTGFTMPTDGGDTTVSNNGVITGKKVARTAIGTAQVLGPELTRSNENWRRIRFRINCIGGSTSATSGETATDFRFGQISDNRQNGCFLESRSGSTIAPTGSLEVTTQLVVILAGAITRQATSVWMGPDHRRRIALDLWIENIRGSRRKVAVGPLGSQDDQFIFEDADFPTDATMRPFIEFEKILSGGTMTRTIQHFSNKIEWV